MKNIQRFIDEGEISEPGLPIIHSTEAGHFRDIIASKKLDARSCKEFNENLLYMFYGKPSYRASKDVNPTTNYSQAPICILLNPLSITKLKRVFPFDSGAFSHGYYQDLIPKNFPVENFQLKSSIDTPKKLINIFFGSNKNYIFGNVKKDIEIGPFDFEIESYYKLITSSGDDDRKSTIELQTDVGVDLDGTNVLAIACPNGYMEDDSFRQVVIGDWNAEVLPYFTFHGSYSSEYMGTIRELVSRFLQSNGYI